MMKEVNMAELYAFLLCFVADEKPLKLGNVGFKYYILECNRNII